MAILAISVILTVVFFRLLPPELAYNFKGDLPDKWISREALIAWTLVPQLFFALLSAGIILGIARLNTQFQQVDDKVANKILSIMGNMVALPQIILSFAMLDIFSYNAYQTHLFPLWVFTLAVMALGGIIMGIFFVSAIRGAVRQPEKHPEITPRSDNG